MRATNKKIKSNKVQSKYRRKLSIRSKIKGTTLRPRACVSKTNKNFHVQIIDDENGITLVSSSTCNMKSKSINRSNQDGVDYIVSDLCQKLDTAGITRLVFDRNGNLYTGNITKIAEGLRGKGITI